MDCANVKAEFGTRDYYLNVLVQKALVEPKVLLKIYEEECQKNADISLYVTFKDFQTALQRYRMNALARNQRAATLHLKQQDLLHHNKQNSARFSPLGELQDHRRKQRRLDNVPPAQMYHRLPHDRFSPQGSLLLGKNGLQLPPATEPTYTSTSGAQPTGPPPPVEDEAPPEFIEMSTHPPRISVTSKFSGMSGYQTQSPVEPMAAPATGVNCKPDPESGNGKLVDGAVQSSSPPNNNSVLGVQDVSPLNVRCVKCITALVTCAAMPCGHCCLCGICGQTVLSLKQVCPVCRKSITTVIGYSNLIYNVYR